MKVKPEEIIYTIDPGKIVGVKMPERSDWTCFLFGGRPENSGIQWTPDKGKEPNWFWRKMQFLILGNRWVKK